jgi:hypothetical protein
MIPFAGQIIQLLSPLWSPTTEPLLQSSLVVTFTKITSVGINIYTYACLTDRLWLDP